MFNRWVLPIFTFAISIAVMTTIACTAPTANETTFSKIKVSPFDFSNPELYIFCGMQTDGRITCWKGQNESYALVKEFPGQFKDFAFAFHGKTFCRLQMDDKVACNNFINDEPIDSPTINFKAIKAGEGGDAVCGITSSDTIECWGDDMAYVPSGAFRSFDIIGSHGCGIADDQSIRCWGDITDIKHDNSPKNKDVRLPEIVIEGQFEMVSVTFHNICALNINKLVQCWGYGDFNNIPNDKFLIVSTGEPFACGITVDEQLKCWEHNKRKNTSYYEIPSYLSTDKFKYVNVTNQTVCAIRKNDTVVCSFIYSIRP